MSTERLPPDTRAKLKKYSEETSMKKLSQRLGIAERTLQAATTGYPVRSATRYTIEGRMREEGL